MYGINGNNDFVNVLGIPIVPDSHKQYVNTDEVTDRIKKGDRDTNIGGYHDIKYFFMDDDGNYSGKPRGYTDQGPISFAAAEISKDIMSLDTEEKDHCSRAIMQIFENGEGQDYSLNNNGERAGILDYMGLANYFGWKVFEWNDPNLRNLEINKILLDYWKKNAGRKDFDPGKRSGGSAGKQGRGALRISCGRIRQAAGRLNGSYSTEQSLAASVAAIAESFDYDEPVLNRMKSAIRYQENVMRKQAAQMEELSDKLSQIAVCYETSEIRIAGELTGRTHRIEW